MKKMTQEELELLSYTDLTEIILKENNDEMTTQEIFQKICDIMGFDDIEYTKKIGDYFTSLTTDKRFVLLDNGKWDLKEKHSIKVIVDDDDEIEEIEEDIVPEEENEDIDSIIEDDELDDLDDDMEDLAIVEEEELDEEN